jgi:hypothetical protein
LIERLIHHEEDWTKEEHLMKKMIALAAAVAVLLIASAAMAQMRPMTPAQPSPAQPPAGTHAPGQQAQPPMMGQGMMGMMCPMMGQSMMGMGMGPGMMGGTMGMSDPRAHARMLKFHGDMMKAMGEVLLKHAQEMEQAK